MIANAPLTVTASHSATVAATTAITTDSDDRRGS